MEDFAAIANEFWIIPNEFEMDDAKLFAEVIKAHGGRTGPLTNKLRELLQTKGVSEAAIRFMDQYAVKKSAQVGPVVFYQHKGVVEFNSEDGIPSALREGLLVFGGCANGDPVVVDLQVRLGTCGYLDGGSMWQAENIRSVFHALSSTPGGLLKALADGSAPGDYNEAKNLEA